MAPALTVICEDHAVVLRTCRCSNPHRPHFWRCPGEKCPGWGTGQFTKPEDRDARGRPSPDLLVRLRAGLSP